MPELPEVETIASGLRSHLMGQSISHVDIPGHATFRGKTVDFDRLIAGRQISGVNRHGKYLQLSFAQESYLLQIHLGMTGCLLWNHHRDPIEKHTHIIFHFVGHSFHLRYRDIRRFGWIEIVEKNRKYTGGLDVWTSKDTDLVHALTNARGYAKNILMNQSVLAGLGNIYVDESLYRAKIHPRRRLESLSHLKRKQLVRDIKQILKESISMGGSSVINFVGMNGQKGLFGRKLRIYGRAGDRCGCGTRIKKLMVAGRGTYICKKCQK